MIYLLRVYKTPVKLRHLILLCFHYLNVFFEKINALLRKAVLLTKN